MKTKENQENQNDVDNWIESFEFSVDIPEEKTPEDLINVTFNNPEPAQEEGSQENINIDLDESSDIKEEKKDKKQESSSTKTSSLYKNVATKFLESGRWPKNLIIETEDGQERSLEDLIETIDEETFFQIEEVLEQEKQEKLSKNSISLDELDERRKILIEIIKNGGALDSIFSSKEQIQEYLNPFQGLDLEDEEVMAQVYFNALVKYNKLDEDAAKAVIDKAKKDLTLDVKVKAFVDKYNESWDKFIESKKQEVEQTKQKEDLDFKNFKKEVTKEVKDLNIKETIGKKVVEILTEKNKEGEFLVDEIYTKKMEDPKEAIELALFLQNKEAYLEKKLEEFKLQYNKDLRRKIKIASENSDKTKPKETEEKQQNEFEYKVKV